MVQIFSCLRTRRSDPVHVKPAKLKKPSKFANFWKKICSRFKKTPHPEGEELRTFTHLPDDATKIPSFSSLTQAASPSPISSEMKETVLHIPTRKAVRNQLGKNERSSSPLRRSQKKSDLEEKRKAVLKELPYLMGEIGSILQECQTKLNAFLGIQEPLEKNQVQGIAEKDEENLLSICKNFQKIVTISQCITNDLEEVDVEDLEPNIALQQLLGILEKHIPQFELAYQEVSFNQKILTRMILRDTNLKNTLDDLINDIAGIDFCAIKSIQFLPQILLILRKIQENLISSHLKSKNFGYSRLVNQINYINKIICRPAIFDNCKHLYMMEAINHLVFVQFTSLQQIFEKNPKNFLRPVPKEKAKLVRDYLVNLFRGAEQYHFHSFKDIFIFKGSDLLLDASHAATFMSAVNFCALKQMDDALQVLDSIIKVIPQAKQRKINPVFIEMVARLRPNIEEMKKFYPNYFASMRKSLTGLKTNQTKKDEIDTLDFEIRRWEGILTNFQNAFGLKAKPRHSLDNHLDDVESEHEVELIGTSNLNMEDIISKILQDAMHLYQSDWLDLLEIKDQMHGIELDDDDVKETLAYCDDMKTLHQKFSTLYFQLNGDQIKRDVSTVIDNYLGLLIHDIDDLEQMYPHLLRSYQNLQNVCEKLKRTGVNTDTFERIGLQGKELIPKLYGILNKLKEQLDKGNLPYIKESNYLDNLCTRLEQLLKLQ